MLKLHKSYLILSFVRVTKKLIQQYVGPFQINKRVGRLAYKLKVPTNWRIHLVFSVAQFELTLSPAKDLFQCPRLQQLLSVFVEGDTNSHKSFGIQCLFNKRTVKKDKGLAIEYLIRQTGYGPKWDRWYNIKDFNNAVNLV